MGDGSLERVLIGQLVAPGGEDDSGRWTGTPPEQGSPPQSGRTGSLGSLGRSNSMYGHTLRVRFTEHLHLVTVWTWNLMKGNVKKQILHVLY